MKRALLIVDVQNDFVEGGSLGVQGGNAVAEAIAQHIETAHPKYDLIVASRDWHEPENSNGGHFAEPVSEPDFVNTWPVHCVQGTEGAEYHQALDLESIDVHIRKGMGEPAYSAFEGLTTDEKTMAEVLRENEITHLDIVGIATDYCVRASCLHALEEGVKVRVLTDLTAGVAPESSVEAIKEMATAGAEIS